MVSLFIQREFQFQKESLKESGSVDWWLTQKAEKWQMKQSDSDKGKSP